MGRCCVAAAAIAAVFVTDELRPASLLHTKEAERSF